MNKGIWAIIVALAFVAGTLMANPVADAAGGWKDALATHFADESAHHEKYTDAESVSAVESATLSSVTTSTDYSYSGPQTRKTLIAFADFFPQSSSTTMDTISGVGRYVTGPASGGVLVAPVTSVPVGATVTSVTCSVLDNDVTHDVTCDLLRVAGASQGSIGFSGASTSGAIGFVQSITSTGSHTHTVAPLFVKYTADGSCGTSCRLFSATVTYTVTEAD